MYIFSFKIVCMRPFLHLMLVSEGIMSYHYIREHKYDV
jgi:hypothetical protein